MGLYRTTPRRRTDSTNPIYHTLGEHRQTTQAETWDYLPSDDRDFYRGVAELMLVPGCPPGLFTKQFAEFAPRKARNQSVAFSPRRCVSRPHRRSSWFSRDRRDGVLVTGSAANPIPPHTFPYLVDKFFYTGASSPTGLGGMIVGSPTGGRLIQDVFDFFDVLQGDARVTGPIVNGTNFTGAAGHVAGPTQPQPDHRRGGILQHHRPAADGNLNFSNGSISFRSHPSPGNVFATARRQGLIPQAVVTDAGWWSLQRSTLNGSTGVCSGPITVNQGVTATDPVLAAQPGQSGRAQPNRR